MRYNLKMNKGATMGMLLALIIFGAANSILLTLQNHRTFDNLPNNPNFRHPVLQTAMIFLGELLCLLPYLLYKASRSRAEQVSDKPKCPFYLPFIPGTLDVCCSVLAYASLNFISASVWQVSRGGNIITTAIFYRLFMKVPLTRASIWGCSLAFIGITSSQILQIFLTSKSSQSSLEATSSNQIIGVVLVVISIGFNTAILIYEKRIFNKYEINPLKMVFLEGLSGLVLTTVLVTLFQTVLLCPAWGKLQDQCIQYNGDYYFQNVQVFRDQLQQDHLLYFFIITLVITICISVGLAVTISKLINPVSRSLADVTRTIFVWIIGLILTLALGEDSRYNLEDTSWLLNVCKFAAFCIVSCGTLFYHGIALPPFLRQKEISPLDSLGDSLLTEGSLRNPHEKEGKRETFI